LQLVQNSVRLYRRIFERFYHGQIHTAEQIDLALSQGKSNDAIRYAHTLKGVAGNLCSPQLVELAKQIESKLLDSTTADINAELVELGELIDSICNAIAKWLSRLEQDDVKLPEKSKTLLSEAELATAVRELLTMLEEADSDAVDKMTDIREQVSEPVWQKMSPAVNMVNSYQFDEAAELIEALFSTE
ncbi:Hpt domain-containing protein, partial [Shewanella sp. 0m-11]